MELNPEVVLAEPWISVVHGPLRSSRASECVCLYLCVHVCVGKDLTATPRAQVANTRPRGRIQPSTLFYLAQFLVSTRRQC